MAFGRFNRQTSAAPEPLSAINVTPLVDVMLVLVVIFILAAPVLAASLRVRLPQVLSAPQPQPQQPALSLEIDSQGKVSIDGAAVEDAQLRERLRDFARLHPQAELQLRADEAVPYGRVAAVMGWAHAAGLERIGFITRPLAQ